MAETILGFCVVRLASDRRAVFGDRLGQFPLLAQGVRQAAVGVGIVGRYPERPAEFGDRFISPAHELQFESAQEAVLGGRLPGLPDPKPEATQGDRADDRRDCRNRNSRTRPM